MKNILLTAVAVSVVLCQVSLAQQGTPTKAEAQASLDRMDSSEDLRNDPDYLRNVATEGSNTDAGIYDPTAVRNFKVWPKLYAAMQKRGLIIGGVIQRTPATLKLCVSLPGTIGCIPRDLANQCYRFPGMTPQQGIPMRLVDDYKFKRHLPAERSDLARQAKGHTAAQASGTTTLE